MYELKELAGLLLVGSFIGFVINQIANLYKSGNSLKISPFACQTCSSPISAIDFLPFLHLFKAKNTSLCCNSTRTNRLLAESLFSATTVLMYVIYGPSIAGLLMLCSFALLLFLSLIESVNNKKTEVLLLLTSLFFAFMSTWIDYGDSTMEKFSLSSGIMAISGIAIGALFPVNMKFFHHTIILSSIFGAFFDAYIAIQATIAAIALYIILIKIGNSSIPARFTFSFYLVAITILVVQNYEYFL